MLQSNLLNIVVEFFNSAFMRILAPQTKSLYRLPFVANTFKSLQITPNQSVWKYYIPD